MKNFKKAEQTLLNAVFWKFGIVKNIVELCKGSVILTPIISACKQL